MTAPLPMTDFLRSVISSDREQGRRRTLLAIGPLSRRIVRVALETARDRRFPLMFIASRNQVDLSELGGGYVCSWDQSGFVAAIREMANAVGFDGLCYLCRDHGGPWQRDEERSARLPAGRAMDIARRSYLEDLIQGFDLLHIDPTKDPHSDERQHLGTVIERTVELIDYVEGERRARRLAPICYEVGTEETSGGLTSKELYDGFISRLNRLLASRGLPLPVFIVGQTGTLVRLTGNVGRFDQRAARELAAVARRHGAGLKEHNADYLDELSLLRHPLLGIAAANVAPEFGVEETAAYLNLAELESSVLGAGAGDTRTSPSAFFQVFSEKAVRSERWRKWMTGQDGVLSVREVLADRAQRERITRICGHYVFEDAEVQQSLAVMMDNLKQAGADPEGYVDARIRKAIERYLTCFDLAGLGDGLSDQQPMAPG